MENRILVIGNFGYHTSIYNGQSIRTRTIYESIIRNIDAGRVQKVDLSKRSLTKYFNLFRLVIWSQKLVLMPGINGIDCMVRTLHFLKKLDHTNIVVIGGWLPEVVRTNAKLRSSLKLCFGIFVQTKQMKCDLDLMGFKNVILFPNYRVFNKNESEIIRDKSKRRFVFYSRICREKGTNLAIEAINKYNETHYSKLSLDLFGPIQSDFKNEFNELLQTSIHITYNGIIDPMHATDILRQYDCMLFPTHYEGEGFPGVILEAFMSGVPVIASDWKYNCEYVIPNKTGFLFNTFSVESLHEMIEKFVTSDLDFSAMCINEATKYSEEKVFQILKDKL